MKRGIQKLRVFNSLLKLKEGVFPNRMEILFKLVVSFKRRKIELLIYRKDKAFQVKRGIAKKTVFHISQVHIAKG